MARNMRKAKEQLSENETVELLKKGYQGVLSLNGDDGYPYGVPVFYTYMNGYVYVHTAKAGYKVDCVRRDSKVSFAALVSSEVVPEIFKAKFESVIVTGKAELIDDEEEKRLIFEDMVKRMSPDFIPGGMKKIDQIGKATGMIRITVEEMKGKAFRG